MTYADIEGAPGYRVSTDGRVQTSWTAGGPRRYPTAPWRDLCLVATSKGYLKVTLSGPAGRRQANVHRLVAEAFIPNPGDLPCVRHLDGHQLNNNVSNLAWGTYADNEADKKRHGTWAATHWANAKLTLVDRTSVRALVADGATHGFVAEQFGVSKSAIWRLINGDTWGTDA